jgi:membrane protein implicated in regulation of membrane protease activity
MNDDEHGHLPLAGGLLLALPAILKGLAALFLVAAGIAIALGRISVLFGGVGLAGAVALALGSAVIERRRVQRAIEESDRP